PRRRVWRPGAPRRQGCQTSSRCLRKPASACANWLPRAVPAEAWGTHQRPGPAAPAVCDSRRAAPLADKPREKPQMLRLATLARLTPAPAPPTPSCFREASGARPPLAMRRLSGASALKSFAAPENLKALQASRAAGVDSEAGVARAP